MQCIAASACFGNAAEATTMIAAASEVFWDGGAACGDRCMVTCTGATNQGVPHPCTGGSVTVKIVDLCPAGCRGTIDLSQEAFALIADPDAGKIHIEYTKYVRTSSRVYMLPCKHLRLLLHFFSKFITYISIHCSSAGPNLCLINFEHCRV
jgi:hypothetical protein